MRIAYIGNFEPEYSTENDVRKAFEHLGHEVVKLQEDKTSWEVVRDVALSSHMLLWTSTWEPSNGGQPFEESLETLRLCALRGIPTATYHLDIFFSSDRGGRKWWNNPMFYTRYVMTVDGDHDDEWKKLGINHIWMPPGVRFDACLPGTYREEYKCDVAFVGSCGVGYHEAVWSYRRELVEKLREICARRGWTFRNPGGELDQPNAGKIERGTDMNDFYASATVTVGDSLCIAKEKSKYWSDRVPEATGRNGFLIMPQIDELDTIYDGALAFYKWNDWPDLEKQIEHYLNDKSDREERRARCYITTAHNHTYVNRAQEMLKVVGLA